MENEQNNVPNTDPTQQHQHQEEMKPQKKKRGVLFRIARFFLINILIVAVLVGGFIGYQYYASGQEAKQKHARLVEMIPDLPQGYELVFDEETKQSIAEQTAVYQEPLRDNLQALIPYQGVHNGLVFESIAGNLVDVEPVRTTVFQDLAVLGTPYKVRGAKGEVKLDVSDLMTAATDDITVHAWDGKKVVKIRGQKYDPETGILSFNLNSDKMDMIALTSSSKELDEYRHLAIQDPDDRNSRELDLYLKVESGGGTITEVRELIEAFEAGGQVTSTISPLRARMLDFTFQRLLTGEGNIFDFPIISNMIDLIMAEVSKNSSDMDKYSRDDIHKAFVENVGYRKAYAEPGQLPDAWLEFPFVFGDDFEEIDMNEELEKLGDGSGDIGRIWHSGFSVFRDGFSFHNVGPLQSSGGTCMGFAVMSEAIYNRQLGVKVNRADVVPAVMLRDIPSYTEYRFDMNSTVYDQIFTNRVADYKVSDPMAIDMTDFNSATNPKPPPLAEDVGAKDGQLFAALAAYWDLGNVDFNTVLRTGNYPHYFDDIERLKHLFCENKTVTVGILGSSQGHAITGYSLEQSAEDPDIYWLSVYENNNPLNRNVVYGKVVDVSNLLKIKIKKVIDPDMSQAMGEIVYGYEYDYLIYTERFTDDELLARGLEWATSRLGGNLNFMHNFLPLSYTVPFPDPCPGTEAISEPDEAQPIEPTSPVAPPEQDIVAPEDIGIGSWVHLGSYHGQPLVWRIINMDGQRALLFSDKIISNKAFDAFGDAPGGRDHQFNHRLRWGSNNWVESNIRDWLNSDEQRVTFSTQAPTAAHVAWGKDAYADEPGFLSNWSAQERAAIVPSSHRALLSWWDRSLHEGTPAHSDVMDAANAGHILKYSADIINVANNYDSAIYQMATDSVFLLSVKELHDHVYQNGMDIRGYLTAEAVANSEVLPNTQSLTEPWMYWLRTPLQGGASKTRMVTQDGLVDNTDCYGAVPGVRPAVYVDINSLVGSGSIEEPLRIR